MKHASYKNAVLDGANFTDTILQDYPKDGSGIKTIEALFADAASYDNVIIACSLNI